MRITERKCDCSFLMMPITDYSETSTLYHPTWEDSGVFTLVYKVNVDGSTTVVDIDLSLHVVDGTPQREVYNLPKLRDGWYKVRSYILPTKDFLTTLGMEDGYNDAEYQLHWMGIDADNAFRKEHNMTLAIDREGIWFLGRFTKPSPYLSGAFYYWLQADIIDVIDEFQNRGILNGFVYGTNVRVVEEDFFTTCHLYKCFINRALTLLDQYKGCSNGSGICSSFGRLNKCKSDIDEMGVQIRDYIWMTLNAINFAVECNDYYTANKLLACISTCSGICDDLDVSDCGCGQYKPVTTAKAAVIPSKAYEEVQMVNFDNYYDKSQIIMLLNTKQDKLHAGIDINITDQNVINNEHRYFSDNDINTLWNNGQ